VIWRDNTVRSDCWWSLSVRVTKKGQVTIPQEVRKRLGIEPGSEVEFQIDEDIVQLVRRTEGNGAALVARIRGRKVTRSTDEIMALTRGDS
jgi:AbrB family looped-hinge helix DNA binding protein